MIIIVDGKKVQACFLQEHGIFVFIVTSQRVKCTLGNKGTKDCMFSATSCHTLRFGRHVGFGPSAKQGRWRSSMRWGHTEAVAGDPQGVVPVKLTFITDGDPHPSNTCRWVS